MMSDKFFSLVLHSHIPYVLAHGSWPHGMDWLYEAAAESYLPLLDVFYRLRDEGVSAPVNVSFTPVLMEQLKSESFGPNFKNYLKMKTEIARKDRVYFEKGGNKTMSRLAATWESWYEKLLSQFAGRYGEDIIAAYRGLQDDGCVEVMTSAATHGYLPLLSRDDSIRAQVRQGRLVYEKYFGRAPRGFWLPECAYRPGYAWKPPLGKKKAVDRLGVDEILGQEGLAYFFVDAHLLKGGEAKGVYLERFPALRLLWEKFKKEYYPARESVKNSYLAYLAHPSGVPFLVRDERSGTQVWSGKTGYPGDGWYLEFHKKHFPGGMRYWRITAGGADLGDKRPYQPEKIRARLEENSGHFVASIRGALKGRKRGVICALYDTELFGHWWYEGPEWLYFVLKKLGQTEVKPQRASDCLNILRPHTLVSLPEGSWGQGGFHWIWLNEGTSWIWEKIYWLEEETKRLKRPFPAKKKRLLRQFIREKFLLESSDWPFLISTWSARDYAENRAAGHFERARVLLGWLYREKPLGDDEKKLLETWEEEDQIFSRVVAPDGNLI
jgi:1,4-alpha-glucan branching enzyme